MSVYRKKGGKLIKYSSKQISHYLKPQMMAPSNRAPSLLALPLSSTAVLHLVPRRCQRGKSPSTRRC